MSIIGNSAQCDRMQRVCYSRSRLFDGSLAAAHIHRAYIPLKAVHHRPCAARQSVEELQQHDVVNVATAEGGSLGLLEVLQGWDDSKRSCKLLWKGQLLQLTAASGEQTGNLQLQPLGELHCVL